MISAKRYALYNVVDGRVTLSTKKPPSEHGLGHLADPSREDHSRGRPEDRGTGRRRNAGDPYARPAVDRRSLAMDAQHGEGLESEQPAWLDRRRRPRLAISSPMMLRPLRASIKGSLFRGQVKPYNFMLAAHVAPFGFPPGDRSREIPTCRTLRTAGFEVGHHSRGEISTTEPGRLLDHDSIVPRRTGRTGRGTGPNDPRRVAGVSKPPRSKVA